MTTKYLITTSIFSLALVSAVRAADVNIPEHPVPIVAAPAFSWTGFYLGGQIGGFSGKTSANYLADKATGKWDPVKKEYLPKLSGFVGGIYTGSNIDIDNGFIIGIDTDIIWSGQKDTRDIDSPKKGQTGKPRVSEETTLTNPHDDHAAASTKTVQHTLKQKWSGATRVRVGFSADRFMPYVAGGVAYTQLRSIFSTKASDVPKGEVDFSDWLHDEKKTMIGYTFGGGFDFAMTDSVIVRAEYRYSDFGKKKFIHDKIEMSYKTNDFRVGVAYKF
ncbi:outer membrane protein [Bartonella phoceensis]|uniref:outer membrane protein n=1 Tax=Bartonella phoceensis TaxID=270249 RepID=UPI001ABB7693|nr:outer membrane protein [Bartonella phoceensis]